MMEEALVRQLSELHVAIRNIEKARRHLGLASGLSGQSKNMARVAQDLQTARGMIVEEMDYVYRKASAVAGPIRRIHG